MILVGTKQHKRTEYMRQAAKQQGLPFSLLSYEHSYTELLEQLHHISGAVKIDPPSFHEDALAPMKEQLERYQSFLNQLCSCHCQFLNHPSALVTLLDKYQCKEVLRQHGLFVTDCLTSHLQSMEELIALMEKRRVTSVFLKPIHYSGAAGVVALRRNPATGEFIAITSSAVRQGQLYNTKHLYRMTKWEEIRELLDCLLPLGLMVERWVPKDTINGMSYDLRVVVQFGKVIHIVVRQSKGPITNLHLNNCAGTVEVLSLSRQRMEAIEELCVKAVGLFDGLAYAGVDVLLNKKSKQPYIIEMNGQGDLIYQDIFAKNRIYGEQAAYMKHLELQMNER